MYKVKIIDIIDEASDVKTYMLEKPRDFGWNIGAHALIGVGYLNDEPITEYSLFRNMSIMTLPQEGKIGFSTKIPGSSSPFKEKLASLGVGDDIGIFGVRSLLHLVRNNQPIIFLSMGVGNATMRPFILEYMNNKSYIPYVINVNVNSTGEFLYQKELDSLVCDTYKNYWLKNRTEFYNLLPELTKIENAVYYLVGSDDFMIDLIKKLKDMGVAPSNIKLDRYEQASHEFYGL